MKASDLIAALQKQIAKHGDQDVIVAQGERVLFIDRVHCCKDDADWPSLEAEGFEVGFAIQTLTRS